MVPWTCSICSLDYTAKALAENQVCYCELLKRRVAMLLTVPTLGHKKAVTGVVGDNLNRYLITTSVDRTIKVM
jgi:hypothetical protein